MPLSVWSLTRKSVRSTRSHRSGRRRRKYRVTALSKACIASQNILASGTGWLFSKTSRVVRWTARQVYFGWIFHKSISQAKALLYWICGQYVVIENNTYYIIVLELIAIIFAIFCLNVARYILTRTLITVMPKPKPKYIHISWEVDNWGIKRTRSGRSYGGGKINIAKRTRSGCVYGYL